MTWPAATDLPVPGRPWSQRIGGVAGPDFPDRPAAGSISSRSSKIPSTQFSNVGCSVSHSHDPACCFSFVAKVSCPVFGPL